MATVITPARECTSHAVALWTEKSQSRFGDERKGFDSNTVPDPTFRENLLFTHGRGIYLMKALMDEVFFEENGAVVRMRKNSNSCASSQGNQDDNHSHNQHLRHRG